MSDWLSSYLEYTENSEPPYSYKTWVGLTVIAACLRRKCVLNWGTLTFYPNMYVVLVGPSGKCRKGTAMRPGIKLLRDRGIKIASESITREALIRELKQSNDTQVNAETGSMHLHSSLTVFSEELTVFLGYNNQQLMADLCNWYDCGDTWTYRTKNMGTDEIIGVWFNLLGATTPDLLQTTLPRDAIGGGLTSRIIFVYEFKKSKTVVDPFLSEKERALEITLGQDLEQIMMLAGEFKVSPDFIEAWSNWYIAQETMKGPIFDDYRFAGYVERRPTHAMKLSMLLSASRSNNMVVTVSDFERALGILSMTEQNMIHTFSGVGRLQTSDILNRVMGFVASRHTTTAAEILRVFCNDTDKRGLEAILETMNMIGFIRMEYTGSDTIIKYIKQ